MVDGERGTASFADVAEGVRATIARYTQALDDGRTDDIVATYCPDGTFDMPGTGTFTGHDALRETYENWKPRRPQRHLVVNTLVTEWSDDEATAVSDVVLVLERKSEPGSGSAGWAVSFVARYTDVLHHDDEHGWRFVRRTVS
jgi:ketosteroid isomerase-like protein